VAKLPSPAGDVAGVIAALKQQPGKDIALFASAKQAQTYAGAITAFTLSGRSISEFFGVIHVRPQHLLSRASRDDPPV
jgi:hypothetical protein